MFVHQDQEMQDKISKLPAWARQHIKHLETSREPLIESAARDRRKAEAAEATARNLRERLDAMTELLTFAHKGGHPDAGEYVRFIFNEYGPQKPDQD